MAQRRLARLTTYQRLAVATLAATLVLVAVGAYTRGSGSGYGCQDRWPLCEGGALGGFLPRGEVEMVVEWTHRWVAATVGLLALLTAWTAFRRHRRDPAVLWTAVGALVLIVVQGYVGAVVVRRELDADLVTLHLTMAMLISGTLVVSLVNSFAAERVSMDAGDRAWPWWCASGAALTFAVVVLGSLVHDRYVAGWPLVQGRLLPGLAERTVLVHLLHRVAAGLLLVLLVWLVVRAVRRGRPRAELILVGVGLGAYLVNVGVGAGHVFTFVDSAGLVVAHLFLATVVWCALVAVTGVAFRAGGVERDAPAGTAVARRASASAMAAGDRRG